MIEHIKLNKKESEKLDKAFEVRSLSNDPRTKVGVIAVTSNGEQWLAGYNFTPYQLTEERMARKNDYMIHAEVILFLNALQNEFDLKDSTVYMTWIPCAQCFHVLAAAGVKRIVGVKKDDDRWGFDSVEDMAKESNIKLQIAEGYENK